MVSQRRRRCATGFELSCAALVRAQPPAAGRERRQRVGPAGGGSGSGAAPPSDGRGPLAAARRAPASRTPLGPRLPRSAARSSSNGSPATAAPSRTRRRIVRQHIEFLGQRRSDRRGNVDVAEPEPCSRARPRSRLPWGSAQAALGRTGCRRSPRKGRRPESRPPPAPRNSSASARLSGRSSIRAEAPDAVGMLERARSRSGSWRGRMPSAMATGAAGGRRSRAPSSSSEARSAQ